MFVQCILNWSSVAWNLISAIDPPGRRMIIKIRNISAPFIVEWNKKWKSTLQHYCDEHRFFCFFDFELVLSFLICFGIKVFGGFFGLETHQRLDSGRSNVKLFVTSQTMSSRLFLFLWNWLFCEVDLMWSWRYRFAHAVHASARVTAHIVRATARKVSIKLDWEFEN